MKIFKALPTFKELTALKEEGISSFKYNGLNFGFSYVTSDVKSPKTIISDRLYGIEIFESYKLYAVGLINNIYVDGEKSKLFTFHEYLHIKWGNLVDKKFRELGITVPCTYKDERGFTKWSDVCSGSHPNLTLGFNKELRDLKLI